MANYKLTNDFWETSGVYDIAQQKTQREINNATTKVEMEFQTEQTLTDNPVVIDNGITGQRFNEFTVSFEPSLTGTPSTSSPVSIGLKSSLSVNFRGYNIANTNLEFGNINASGEETSTNMYERSVDYIPIKAETTYTTFYIQTTTNSLGFNIAYYNSQQQFMERTELGLHRQGTWVSSFTVPEGAAYIRYVKPEASNSVQIVEGEINLPYQEFFNDTYTFSLGGTYAGGRLDLLTGVFTERYYFHVFDGTETLNPIWAAHPALRITGNPTILSNNFEVYCSHFPTVTLASTTDTQGVYVNNGTSSGDNRAYIQFRDYTICDDISDTTVAANKWRTFFSNQYNNGTPVVVTYRRTTSIYVDHQVAEPQDFSLKEYTNYVSTDGDEISVSYGEVLKNLYSEFDNSPKKTVIAPVEESTTASRAYSINEMFFMGDKLYIATAAIASGATFTVGTNCDETTLGEQIAALLNA